jgi:hypothetical protein
MKTSARSQAAWQSPGYSTGLALLVVRLSRLAGYRLGEALAAMKMRRTSSRS